MQTIYKYRLHYASFIFLIAYMLYVRLCLVYSYSLDLAGLEYYFLHFAHLLQEGKPFYQNPEAYPYANCLYSPIYFYAYVFTLYVSKVNTFNDLHEALIVGRFFSFACVLMIIYYLKKIADKFSVTSFQLLVYIALFLLLITSHLYVIRPDALKVLFFILFMYYFIEYLYFSKKRRHAILSVVAAILAVYTKQDIAVHITICFLIAYSLERNRKIIFLFIAFFLSCALLFLLMLAAFGKIIIADMILFNIQTITNVWASYNIIFVAVSLSRTLPLLYIAFLNYKKTKQQESASTIEKFIILTTFFLFPVAHMAFLKPGSNFNYSYELVVFLVLNIIIFVKLYADEINLKKKRYAYILFAYTVFLMMSTFIPQTYFMFQKKEANYKAEYFNCLAERKKVNDIIKNDTVFFPNTKYSIYFEDKNVILGYDMHLDRFINLYSPFHIDSKLTFIDTKNYDNNFKTGMIQYIIVQNDEKSAAHVKKYYPAYSLYQNTGFFNIYRFKQQNP